MQLKRGLRKKLWQHMHNPSGQTMPAFVVGCGRSGTSMLLHRLGRSPAVDPYNENHEAAFDKFRLHPLDVIETLVDRSYANVALFKPVLCTPHSSEYLVRFPEARLIFVYRHYNDVVNSSLKRFGSADRLTHVNTWMADNFAEFAPIAPPEKTQAVVRELWKPTLSPESAAALYWLFYNRLYFDLNLDEEERAKLISYESLVTNAVSVIKEVCSFLGLEFMPAMADDIFATSVGRDEQPALDSDIEESCEGLWQEIRAAHTNVETTKVLE